MEPVRDGTAALRARVALAEAWPQERPAAAALPSPQELGLPLRGGRRIAAETAYGEILVRLLTIPKFQACETGLHLVRISDYVRLIASRLALAETEAELMAVAASLHDLGKLGTPAPILAKPGPLDPGEWAVMQRHPLHGARLLGRATTPLLQLARIVALTHHEAWDGSGYPRGLAGEAIPLAGRIVLLADRYDALRSWRPYKPALDHAAACDVILHGDGRCRPEHLDPRLRDLFRRSHRRFDAIWRRWEEAAQDARLRVH